MPGPTYTPGHGLPAVPKPKAPVNQSPANLGYIAPSSASPAAVKSLLNPGLAGLPAVARPNPAVAAITGKAAATATQQMLKRLGYSVSVDGVIGPETKSALAAQKAGIKAAVWNASRIGGAGAASTQSTQSGAVGPSNAPGAPAVSPQDKYLQTILANENAALPPDNSSKILALQGLLSQGQVDPKLLATADANQAYNPTISALRQNLAQTNAQGAQNQTDIKGWYDALVNNIAVRNSQNATSNTQAVNAIGSATGGVAGALGLGADTAGGANIYQTGNIQAAAAQANAASEQSYGRDLQGVTAAQGVQSLVNQRNTDANKSADLQAQERAQEAARGQAIVSGEGTYRQQNITNRRQYATDRLALQQAAQTSKNTRFNQVAALGSQKIAVQNASNTAVNNADKNAITRRKNNQAYTVALQKANALSTNASANNTKAQTAAKLANNKITTASSSLFPGLSAKDSVNTLFNIQTKLAGDKSLFDKDGKVIRGRQQALAVALRSDLAKAGADPRLNIEAKYQAFNILQALGVTPQANWFPS